MKGLKVKKGDELFIKATDVGRWIWPLWLCYVMFKVVESVGIYDVFCFCVAPPF